MSSGLEQMRATQNIEVGMAPPRRPEQPPQRGVARYNSGGASRMVPRRAPPKRSQSHRIGRPTFNAKDGGMPPPAVPEAVGRNTNQRFTRAAPVRSGSFQRSVPNRSSSTSSLRAYRKAHHATPLGKQIEVPETQMSVDNGDCDSVFTSASNQTLDSIMLRKKQITPNDIGGMAIAARRPRSNVAAAVGSSNNNNNNNNSHAQATFDFDESLHTVDSIGLHMRHVHQVLDEQCDLSVFSESFASTDTYILSDYEDDDDDDDDDDKEDYKDLE